MPIYEFRCVKCQDVFEFLMKPGEDAVEMACPKCGAEEFERVMSCTNFAMSGSGGGEAAPSATVRNCSSGNCTTWNVPGCSK